MLAQVTLRNNDAITAPAGWTTTGNLRTSGATLEQRIYYRIATAADTAGTTYQWSWTTSSDGAAAILAYSGTDATNPIDVAATDNAGSGTTATATGLTTTQTNDMLDAFYGVQGQSGPAVTATQDAAQGMTQEYTIASGSAPASRARVDRRRRHAGECCGHGEQDRNTLHLHTLGRASGRTPASAGRRRRRHADDPDDERLREPDREHDHVHLHGSSRRYEQRLAHPRRTERLDRTEHHEQQRGLHDCEHGHGLCRCSDDHRLEPDAGRRRNGDDHVRRHERRWPRCDGNRNDRSADLAGPAEGAEHGNAHESRLVAEHHGQRRRRLGHPDDADLGGERLADRPHDHVHLHGGSGRHQQRDGHTRRAERLDRSEHHEQQRRLHDRQRGHRFGREPDDHRLLAHDRRRLDLHDHLRGHEWRRDRCDGNGDDRRPDVAGAVEVDCRRLPREPRRLTEHHRLRRRRHWHADHTDLGRERVADRPHDHLHLHRRDRRHQQRLGHARRPGRLERTVDHRRERRLHDRQLGHGLRREPDDHRLLADTRRRLDRSRSPTARPRAAARVQPRRPRQARRPGRHRRSPRPPAHSRTSAPRRASPSTPPTAQAR